jgi:hypothetical protein
MKSETSEKYPNKSPVFFHHFPVDFPSLSSDHRGFRSFFLPSTWLSRRFGRLAVDGRSSKGPKGETYPTVVEKRLDIVYII